MDEDNMIKKLTNQELIHRLKYCRKLAKDHITNLKLLAITNDKIKEELKNRISALEKDIILAETHRLMSDDPIFDALLDLH